VLGNVVSQSITIDLRNFRIVLNDLPIYWSMLWHLEVGVHRI
jgi:hypothetical protein